MTSTSFIDERLDPDVCVIGEAFPCKLSERAILPVRFSLTKKALEEAAKTGKVPPPPTGVDDENYELRRLRQGYFYMFAELRHVGQATDHKNKFWLIFKYNVSLDDSNGTELNQIHSGKSRYSFSRYIWSDGHARGEWKEEERDKAYAYINPEVSIIEYAYSEERWPAKLLEKLELDPNARSEVMQKANVFTNEKERFVLPFTQLTQKVTDFNPSKHQAQADNISNRYRATGVGYDNKHTRLLYEQSLNEEGKILAVYDPVGNTKDIIRKHKLIWDNYILEQSKYRYPIATAKAIKQIEQHVYKDPSWFKKLFSDHPIDKKFRDGKNPSDYIDELDAYASDDIFKMQEPLRTILADLSKKLTHLSHAYSALLNQRGACTIDANLKLLDRLNTQHHTPIKKLLAQLEIDPNQAQKIEKEAIAHLSEIADYTVHYHARIIGDISVSPQGVSQVEKLLTSKGDQASQKNHASREQNTYQTNYAQFLINLLSTCECVRKSVNELVNIVGIRRINLELLIEGIAAAQLSVWSKLPNGAGLMQVHYHSAFGFFQKSFIGSERQICQTFKRRIKNLVDGSGDALANIHNIYEKKMGSHFAMLETKPLKMKATFIIPDELPKSVIRGNKILKQTPKIGTFFASGLLLLNLREWTDNREEDNLFLHPALRVFSDCTALIASLDRSIQSIEQSAIKKGMSRIDDTLLKKAVDLDLLDDAFVNELDEAANTHLGKGVESSKTLQNVGRIANVLAVLIATGQAIKAHHEGDDAAKTSAITTGTSEISFLLASFATGGVATLFIGLGVTLVVISVATSLVADNAFEKWVRTGFWGNSSKYWGEDRTVFSERLKDTLVIAYPNKKDFEKIDSFFEKEMQDFYNLIWGMTVDTSSANQGILIVNCPAFETDVCLNRLNVEVVIPQMNRSNYDIRLLNIAHHKIKKRFEFSGAIRLDLTQTGILDWYEYINPNQKQENHLYLRRIQPSSFPCVINIKYPKLGETPTDLFVDYFKNSVTYSPKGDR